MAKSFLAEQIMEVRGGLQGLAQDLGHLDDVNAQVLSRKVGVTTPGGLVGPSGQPLSPSGAGGGLGAGSIAEFLQRREAGGGRTISSGDGSGGSGSRSIAPSPGDLAVAQTLGESVEYVRQLMKAAAWAGLSAALVLRSPKAERDALIAAYEASGGSGMGSSKSGGGSGTKSNPINPGDKYGDTAFTFVATNNSPMTGGAQGAQGASAKAAPDPTPAIASGAQATVAALGKVVGELQRLNERVAKTPVGIDVALRTGAGG